MEGEQNDNKCTLPSLAVVLLALALCAHVQESNPTLCKP